MSRSCRTHAEVSSPSPKRMLRERREEKKKRKKDGLKGCRIGKFSPGHRERDSNSRHAFNLKSSRRHMGRWRGEGLPRSPTSNSNVRGCHDDGWTNGHDGGMTRSQRRGSGASANGPRGGNRADRRGAIGRYKNRRLQERSHHGECNWRVRGRKGRKLWQEINEICKSPRSPASEEKKKVVSRCATYYVCMYVCSKNYYIYI